jgi:Fe-S cluster assembly protein SufD
MEHERAAAWRESALGRFEQLGLPTKRDEAWKYSALSAASAPTSLADAGPKAAASVVLPSQAEAAPLRLVFVDGALDPGLSRFDAVAGVSAVRLCDALANPDGPAAQALLARDAGGAAAMDALNAAFARDGALLRVEPRAQVEQPIWILSFATSSTGALAPLRHLVSVGAAAECTVVHWFSRSDDTRGWQSDVTDVVLEASAQLRYVKVSRGGALGMHLGAVNVSQERDSRFFSHVFALGGGLNRTEVTVSLNGTGGETQLDGLSLARGEERVDHQTCVEHRVASCTSNQRYKGIFDGSARGVFAGRVYVAPLAVKTNAEQRNANLLLSGDAEVDTKPELEIYADDVRCAHGATVGALDAQAMFYLRSRGISPEAARAMMMYGFALEMVERLPLPALQVALREAMGDWTPPDAQEVVE